MRKGITPIIAIIVLLLITIALAGATWTYLSVYWQSMIGVNIQVMESYCTGGNTGTMLLRNTGTQEFIAESITVINSATDEEPDDGEFKSIAAEETDNFEVAPGDVFKYVFKCEGMCNLRFIMGGRSQVASVLC